MSMFQSFPAGDQGAVQVSARLDGTVVGLQRGAVVVESCRMGRVASRFVPNPLPSSFRQSLPIRSKIEPLLGEGFDAK